MKNKAFTMAEALIVLSIVAVLASMSVVAVSNAKPDESIIMFRRAYSTTLKVIDAMLNDRDVYPNADLPYKASSLGNVNNKRGLYGVNFASNFRKNVSPIASDTTENADTQKFTTSDGIYWEIVNQMSSSITPCARITFYVNGKDSVNSSCSYKQTTCPIPTKFMLYVDREGKVYPTTNFSSPQTNPDNMAITYIRYSKITKHSQFPDVYSGS